MKFLRQTVTRLCIGTILAALSIIPSKAQNTAFNTDGLYNAAFFDYIYRGHFENIEMKTEDMEFLSIFEQYLRTYGGKCPDFLPDDKVMIMNTECAREQVSVMENGLGIETSRTTTCVEWREVPSNLYARPDLYHAKIEVERNHEANALKTTLALITDPNALGNSVDMVHKSKALLFDMARIFELNSCNSSEIRRFEENLKLFALGKSPIRMEGESKYVAMKKSGGPTGPQDFSRLIDDLVADQAKTWMFNRYSSGSISQIIVQTQDDQGRPVSIKANYNYSGFSGTSRGWVKISFNNGLPEGMYFFDYPNNRKSPNSSIVASYAQGNYNK
jgi:hypothetical protein